MPSPDLMPSAPSPFINQVSPSTGFMPGFHPYAGHSSQIPVMNYDTLHHWDDENPYYEGNLPSQQEVIDTYGLESQYDSGQPSPTTGYEKDDSQVHDNEAAGASLAEYLQQNPGTSYMDALKYMSQYSDEWAEKYIDYIAEQEGLDKANAYTAQREDTAYQRLVADLKAAGLNPAMMYGNSASPIGPSGSQGYVKTTEGATSRGISNYSKIQKLILAYLGYELQKNLGTVNGVFKGIDSIFNALGKVLPFTGLGLGGN